MIKNESRQVTYRCEADRCEWQKHALNLSIETLNDVYNCIQVNKNRDMISIWLWTEYGELLRSIRDIIVETLKQLVMKKTSLEIQLHILYKA